MRWKRVLGNCIWTAALSLSLARLDAGTIEVVGSFAYWPAEVDWQAITELDDPDDGEYEHLDFVGDSSNRGVFRADATNTATGEEYICFRLRVDAGTVTTSTFSDTLLVMIDVDDDKEPDFAFAWDSRQLPHTSHSLEMVTFVGTNASWSDVAFDDVDGNGGQKIAPPDFAYGSSDGYIRTIDGQSTTSFGTTSYVDFAVSWEYLRDTLAVPPYTATYPKLPYLAPGHEWRIAVGSISNGNDHNPINVDVAGGAGLADDPLVSGWSDPQQFGEGGDIEGYVYRDDNGNNSYDAGEGLAGIRVDITASDAAVYTVTTDADGYFLQAGLPTGATNVNVVDGDLPAGILLTPMADGYDGPTGAEGEDVTVLNGSTVINYNGYSVDTTVPLAVAKTTTNGSTFTIGDTIDYRLVISVPDTVSYGSVVVTDTLDPNIKVDPASVPAPTPTGDVTITSSSISATNDDPVADWAVSEVLEFDLTTVSGGAAGGTIIITYSATVYDTSNNTASSPTKNNNVAVTDTAAINTSASASVTLVEPDITVTKTVRNITPCTPSRSREGKLEYHAPEPDDILEFTLNIENGGTSTAYDLTITDTLSLGLEYILDHDDEDYSTPRYYITIDPQNTGGDGVVSEMVLVWGNDQLPSPLKVDIPSGESLILRYHVRVLGGVSAGDPLSNAATVKYYSLDGAGGREYTDSDGIAINAWDDPSASTFTAAAGASTIDADGVTSAGISGSDPFDGTSLLVLEDGASVEVTGNGIPDHVDGYPYPFGTPSVTVEASATIISDGSASFSIDDLVIEAGATLTLEGDTSYAIGSLTMGEGSTLVLPDGASLSVAGAVSIQGTGSGDKLATIQPTTTNGGLTLVFGCSVDIDYASFAGIGSGSVTFQGPTAMDNAVFSGGDGTNPYVIYEYPAAVTWSDLAFRKEDGASLTIQNNQTNADTLYYVIVNGYLGPTDINYIAGNGTDVEPLATTDDDLLSGVRWLGGTGTVVAVVYYDADGDGQYGAGDTLLSGVDVTVTDANGAVHYLTTDATGSASAVVAVGYATVDIDDADVTALGYSLLTIDTYDQGSDPTTVAVPANGTVTDTTGYVATGATGTVEGTVFHDNGDGIYVAADDTELSGIGVRITDAYGTTYDLLTDGSGYFSQVVPPGLTTVNVSDVDIQFSLPGATLISDAVNGEGSDPTVVTVAAGDTATDNTGYIQTGSTGTVDGTVYIDVDADGAYTLATDTPLANVDVVVTDVTGGVYTFTTDGSGQFSGTVAAGDASVDVDDADLPTGAILTTGASDPTTVTVPGGGTGTDDTGYLVPDTDGTIAGIVYLDVDHDGTYVVGTDTLLPNIDVTVTDVDSIVHNLTTDANGYFSQVVPTGWTSVDVDQADVLLAYPSAVLTIDDHNQGSDPSSVYVPIGSTAYDKTGYYALPGGFGVVDGTVYIDNDGNGSYDGTDQPLPNVHVTITDVDSPATTYTITTDAYGYFSQIMPIGDTQVDVADADLPGVWSLTDNTFGEGDDPTTVSVLDGDTVTDNTGYTLGGGSEFVQGTLYLDVNGDGLYNNGDTPIANIEVTITDSSRATYTVSSDANGYFQQAVATGSVTVSVNESDPDFPSNVSLTTDANGEGSNPTVATVLALGAATDNTGYLPAGATPAYGVRTCLDVPESGGVLVRWSAQVELGVLEYLVQVADGNRWDTLGKTFATTEGIRGGSYEFLDRAAPAGVERMYRLVCVDVDGSQRTHAVGSAMAIAPAPAAPAAQRLDIPVFPADGVVSVETLSYTVDHYATDTPAILGSAQRSEVAGGLYELGGVSRVYNVGAELPVLDGMVYIRPYSDPYTDANVVWGADQALTVVGEPGTPPAPPAQGLLDADGFRAVVHVEKDETLALNSMLPPGPNWFYGYSSRLAPGNNPILVADVPSPAATGTAVVRVAVRSTTSGAHDLGLQVNGVAVARATWSGNGHYLVRFAFDLAACPLLDGKNQFRLWTTATDSSKRLDYLEVETPAAPVLRDGSLVVGVLEGAPSSLAIDGAVYAVDITDFGAESLLARRRGVVSGLTAGRQVLFASGSSGAIVWDGAKDLSAVAAALGGKNYVAVAPVGWSDVLDPLVAKRAAGGLDAVAVSWEDVRDTYGCGLPTPAALVRMVACNAPQYLLIGAGASHDPKGLQGDLPPAGIPTSFVHVYEGTASTDDPYLGADCSTAVGRLPARSRAELLNMVNKIVDFYPGRRAVMMADVDDGSLTYGSFADLQAELAESLPSTLLDANVMNGAAMRTALIAAINDGANLVTYQGHGNNALIGDNFDIVNTGQVASVPPSAWLLATCLTGVYTLEDDETPVLASSLLRTAGNGAVSVLASTCYGEAGVEHLIVQEAVRQIAAGGATWGQILLAVKQTLLPRETAAVYTLLGDPAMGTLNPVEGDREIVIRSPVAGSYITSGDTPAVAFGLRGEWWRQTLEISWRRDYGEWTPLKQVIVDPETFEYTIPWDPPPEDGTGYQIMIREIAGDREGE